MKKNKNEARNLKKRERGKKENCLCKRAKDV